MMAIARINLYLQSLLFIAKIRSRTVNKPAELACLAIYFTWLGALLSTLPSWHYRVAYVSIGHAVLGFLHVQICLSHFSMPCYFGKPMSGQDEDSWFVTQVRCRWRGVADGVAAAVSRWVCREYVLEFAEAACAVGLLL